MLLFSAGMPWDVRNKDDKGGKLLKVILTNGWLTNLYRSFLLPYHPFVMKVLSKTKDKYKNKKINEVKKWEEAAIQIASDHTNGENRKNKRLMLALLLENYVTLLEDQPMLVGPRIVLILTLLAHASSEVNWLVVHQNEGVKREEPGKWQSLHTTQETLTILHYTIRLRNLINKNKDLLFTYLVETMKNTAITEILEMISQMDVSRDLLDQIRKINNNVKKVDLEETEEGLKISNKVHVYDLGRIITEMSATPQNTSSPIMMNPKMIQKLEITTLHFHLLEDPFRLAERTSDLSFLFFFKGTFEYYFTSFLKMQDKLSYIITFPQICQEFGDSVSEMCSEEYEIIISETHDLASGFLNKMSEVAMEYLDVYVEEVFRMEAKQQAFRVASVFSAGEKEHRERQENKDLPQKKKRKESTTKTPKSIQTPEVARRKLFDSKIEMSTIGLKEILKAFFTTKSIIIASYTFFPESFFLDKLSDKILEKLKGFFIFPALPSDVKFNIKTLHQALIHIDPGLDVAILFQDILYGLRNDSCIISIIMNYLNSDLMMSF